MREKGERTQRTNKREREREIKSKREKKKMNKIYYFRLQYDEQLVVNMKLDCSRMLNNFGFPSPDGALLLGLGG